MLQVSLSGIKKFESMVNNNPENISLSQGAIKVGTGIPQEIKNHIQQLMMTDKTDYYESCWGIQELRCTLASTLSAAYKTKLSSKQILPTHGCTGGLSILFLTLVDPGDEIIIPQPSYPIYTSLTQAARGTPVFIPTLLQNNNIQFIFIVTV